MKVIYIECNEDELKANRTVLDSVSDALSAITRAIAGVDVTPETLAEAKAYMDKEGKEDEENEV